MAKPPTDVDHLGSTIALQMKACENIKPNFEGESERVVFENVCIFTSNTGCVYEPFSVS